MHCKNATNPTAKHPCGGKGCPDEQGLQIPGSHCLCCSYGCNICPELCKRYSECGLQCFCNCAQSLPDCLCLKESGYCRSGVHEWPPGHCEFCHCDGQYCGGNPVKSCPRP